ncbi:alpha/beta hydrolase family protein [Streptomyces sp. NPDC006711]|uniref:alpha/beta hydrolase family protein n=1 Tax=Streptomyces sp. NPDC006711 TaxID=3364762 RepID=UPI0036B8096B
MKFLFDDESFSFETLRAAGFTAYQGADLGEILVTARDITDGDEPSWHRAWKATAERVAAIGEGALASGHRVSAREALLRASNYYRTAEFYLRDAPATDPEVALLSRRSRETFVKAVALLDTPVETVAIPYEDTTLPGYLFLVDDSGAPRPTVIYTNGFDSTAEEAYFVIAAAALRRGYNVLAFDGPGQGAVLREQQLTFRPDWEAVTTPVVDYALSRPETDPARVALFGYSLGGCLVARAAAYEHRVAALILDDGVLDFGAAFERGMPAEVITWIAEGRDAQANAALAAAAAENTQVRWALRNGVWTLGAQSYADLVRRSRPYALEGHLDKIVAPALVLEAANDQFFEGQPRRVAEGLVNASATLVTLSEAEGSGEHCHVGAFHRAHQVMFDWLDTTLVAS